MGAFDFIALDVETANAWRASICQVGVVGFRGGAEVFTREWLIDPRDHFDDFNVRLHGIGPETVRGAPTFAEHHPSLAAVLHGEVVVAHSPFDRGALGDACDDCGLTPFGVEWVDSVSVSRMVWPHLENHRLPTVAGWIGHTFRHHGALEDARAAGLVLLQAMADGGLTLDDCARAGLERLRSARSRAALTHAGSDGGILTGETVVLTGDFANSKADLAALAAAAGAAVTPGVNRKTTILVVGGRDPRYASRKSGKQQRAEELIAGGQPIAFLTEDQLLRLIA